jgi:hypothetical protein
MYYYTPAYHEQNRYVRYHSRFSLAKIATFQ